MWNNQGNDTGYGDQGGGYLNSPNNFSSPQGSQPRRSKNRAQNIMPCTAAQIFQAVQTEDSFVIDNVEIYQVTIVGLVRSVKEATTHMTYEIDDMSGPPIEVRQFVDNDENAADNDRTLPMRENTYVRVYGSVRAFGGKRNLMAFRLYQLVDMNELTTHLLEVIHSHLALTKAQATQAAPVVGGGESTMTSDYTGALPDTMSGLTNIQKQVSLVIQSCRDEQGMSISSVCERLRGIPQNAVRLAIDFLSGEGHIYSTIDDDHFRSTESMD